MLRHLVVGAGEVGSAIHTVLGHVHDTTLRDLEPVEVQADVLHVCIPWSERFVEAVRAYEVEHGTDLVVVHSTVPVGTCDAQDWVHSPVRGRHPNLVDGLFAFVKHFGGRHAAVAAKQFAACGVQVEVHDRAAEAEAAKLWELAQFGVQVKMRQAIRQWCDQHGVDDDTVYRAFAETYNHGYTALGETQFVRPILEYVPGPIGGHCVRENAALLDHPLAEWVAE